MTGVQTCALPICFPVTIHIDEVVKNSEKALKDEDDIISTDSSCCDEPFLKATKPEDFLCEYIKCSPGCKCINGLCFNFLGLQL